ncbi:MAG: hypothetical protein ACFFBH_07040 [Promethearchaeota archaeon]
MVNCSTLEEGDTLVCENCGLEMKVTKTCSCGEEEGACTDMGFTCCGIPLSKK